MIEHPAPDKITVDFQAPRTWRGDSPHTRYVHRWRPWPAWVWTCPCCKKSGHHSLPPPGTHDAWVDRKRGRRHAFARAWRAAEFHLWKYHGVDLRKRTDRGQNTAGARCPGIGR